MIHKNSVDRIKALIKSQQIIIPKSPTKTKDQIDSDTFILKLKEIPENSLIGTLCGGIVVAKDEQKKLLLLHLISSYDSTTGKQTNISCNKYLGYLKDYELKNDMSIFTYINSFKNIEIGAFINAIVRKIQKRQVTGKNIFELCLNVTKKTPIKIGIIKDQFKTPQSILKVFEKEQTLPMNFQILYTKDYDNPGINHQIIQSLNLTGIGSLHRMSNISSIQPLHINLQRIRYVQEKQWSIQHLEIGLDCIRNGRNETALDCLNLAKRFDSSNPEIYIAKGCTLINMNNLQEGIKQLKQALKIDPRNTKARQYYDKVTKQISDNKQQVNGIKRRNYGENSQKKYNLVHKK